MLIVSDLLLLGGTGLVCRALSRGHIRVAAPIAASYGGVSALLSALAGASLDAPKWIAIALITIGCVLAAGRGKEAKEISRYGKRRPSGGRRGAVVRRGLLASRAMGDSQTGHAGAGVELLCVGRRS